MSPAMRAAPPVAPTAVSSRPLPLELLALLRTPGRAFPALFERNSPLALVAFPAVSGIYVAYAVASGIGAANRFGLVAAALAVLVGGATLGMVALWFAGTLPNWTDPGSAENDEDAMRMFYVFSYATWPFLPLLAIVIPVEVWLYGASILSPQRPPAPAAIVWGVRVLELSAITLWLVMMLKGTAIVRHESDRLAARELVRWGSELLVIGVLFALIVMASVMYW